MKTRNVIGSILLLAIFWCSCKKDATQSPAAGSPKGLAASKSLNSLSLSHFRKKLSKGLLAWYPFLGNANDMSGNGNNGSLIPYTDQGTGIQGNLPVLAPDKCGNANAAYSFDGTGGYISTHSFFTDSVSEFSLYVRFKSGSSGTLLGTGDFYFSQPATYLNVAPDNSIYFSWQNSDVFGDVINSSVHSDALTVRPNAWIDVVVNFKNSVLTMYVDGKMAASATASFPVGDMGSGGTIGASQFRYPNNFLIGAIGEVRVYDKALSVEAICELYRQCKHDRRHDRDDHDRDDRD